MIKKCLISGSFDPITKGHIDLLERALQMSDQVIIGVFNNEEKEYLFDFELRVKLCNIATKHFERVQVIGDAGMLYEFCKRENIDGIVRGFRNYTDYEYETEMAKFNYLNCGVMTYLLPASSGYSKLSSSIVRQLFNNCKSKFNDSKKTEEIENYLPKDVVCEIRRMTNE